MHPLQILGIFTFALLICGCGKKSESAEKEIREAGYEVTTEGWFKAAEAGDIKVLEKMVATGFDEKTKNKEGNSALHIAAANGNKSVAEYLLNRGFSVDEKGANDRTPLMAAVITGKSEMVNWLLSQGADPKIKDSGGFMALMLATSNGQTSAVEELAPYHREDLDSALLLAALLGKTETIDTLTNYGASVYARMDDDRTPLMLAAENGHIHAVALLMDIGASRFATTGDGRTAQSFAVAAGREDIAKMIETGFTGDLIALESDEQVAAAMEEYVEEIELVELSELPEAIDPKIAANTNGNNSDPSSPALPQKDLTATASPAGSPIGAVLPDRSTSAADLTENDSSSSSIAATPTNSSASTSSSAQPSSQAKISSAPTPLGGAEISSPSAVKQQVQAQAPAQQQTPSANNQQLASGQPPLIMRHYRQRELPVEVKKVSGGVASLRLVGENPINVDLTSGQAIPNSTLVVVKVYSRTEIGKLNNNQPIEVGIVEVEDTISGQRAEWIEGRSAPGHDPVALVEDAITGQRYVAKPGQTFTSEDGREYKVNDVRPSQLIIEEISTGEVSTLPLRGPKG